MFLKSLSITNYKCFKDMTVINFETDSLSVILGGNGSGKTTLIEVLSHMHDRYKGHDIPEIHESQLSCTVVDGSTTATYRIENGVEFMESSISDEIIGRFFSSLVIVTIDNSIDRVTVATSNTRDMSMAPPDVLNIDPPLDDVIDHLKEMGISWCFGRESSGTKIVLKILDAIRRNCDKILIVDGFGYKLNAVSLFTLTGIFNKRTSQTLLATNMTELSHIASLNASSVIHLGA